MNDSDMVFLVHSDIVVLTDLRETFCAAGLDVREFRSHDCTLAVLRSGSLPRAAVFDTPLDNSAIAFERELKDRGIPCTRLTAVVGTEPDCDLGDGVVEVPFRASHVLETVRRRIW
jgi:hypothetical protein